MDLKDKWLRIIGIPIIAVMESLYWGWAEWQAGSWKIFREIGISLLFTFFIWEGCRIIYVILLKRYPDHKSVRKRLIIEIILCLSFASLMSLLIGFIINNFVATDRIDQTGPFRVACILTAAIPTVLLTSIYEAKYFLKEWKKKIKQTEELARVHLISQFETLKKQLDPHFLFNSLNTLASLIKLDNEPAQHYLERLSDVYRYVLETRNKTTVTIEEELHFLEAYMYLNKVRFRDNLLISKDLSPGIFEKHIPALSLQLLVENAIKHNIISKENPLHIQIYTEGEQIVVANNKQLKSSLERSTRVGLNNIRERYQLLTAQPISVRNTDKSFQVSLPLLQASYI
ncbi:MAG: histidine kinase [Bacteroidota bacterium]